ncbi:MAG TPA: MFS transporter [Thermodesulfobacteriota bacterium]|nr:MFS transporter [Thermodesulfobacteriota bacterium]
MLSGFRKDLILVALAGTIVVMGLGFIIPLFPIYVSQKGASNFELGLIVSGFTISQFLVQPFFGGFSDRFGRKSFMVGGLACYGLVAALYVFAVSLPQVFLVRLLHGVGAGMIWPALSAFVVDQAPLEKRGETMGFLSGVEMIGFALGPILGGGLYTLGGMNLPFFGCAALSFLSMGIIWSCIREKPRPPRTAHVPFLQRYGFASLRVPDIRLLCLIGFSEAFVWGLIITLLPVMASRLNVPPGKIGWLFSAYFVVYILLQWPVGRWSDRNGRKKPILVGMSIYTLAVLLLSQAGSMISFLAMLALAGAGLGIYSPSVRVAVADLTSEKARGASLGVFFTTRMFGFFLGPNLGGIIADAWGQGVPFAFAGLLAGMGIWASCCLSPELSRSLVLDPSRTE